MAKIREGVYVPSKVKKLLDEHPAAVAHRLGNAAKSVRTDQMPLQQPQDLT